MAESKGQKEEAKNQSSKRTKRIIVGEAERTKRGRWVIFVLLGFTMLLSYYFWTLGK